jgi:hypothetical protein
MVWPLDQNADNFQGKPAEVRGNHGLQNKIVIDISGRQRCNRDIGVHLQHFDIQPLVFEIALEVSDTAAQKRHIRIGHTDINRFGFDDPSPGSNQNQSNQNTP